MNMFYRAALECLKQLQLAWPRGMRTRGRLWHRSSLIASKRGEVHSPIETDLDRTVKTRTVTVAAGTFGRILSYIVWPSPGFADDWRSL